MISLADLTTPLTRTEVETSIYNVLGALGVSTTSWKAGAVPRACVTAFALLFSALTYLSASLARSAFLDLAVGDWLTLTAWYVYRVLRVEATFAAGEVTLTNPGGGVYSYDPDDLTVVNSATGKSYRNTSAFTLNPASSITIAVVAVEAGAASTSVAGAIDAIESGPTGVTVSNALAVVGQDAESDPLLRVRCREKLGSLSPNGPWDAYSYVARNAKRADGSTIGVTRVRVVPDGYGYVYVYVATATGAVSGTVGDTGTDLGAIDEAIQRLSTPLGVTAIVASAEVVVVPVTYTATMYNNSGSTEQQIKDTIGARLAAFMAAQPVGGNVGLLYVDAIRTNIGAAYAQIFTTSVALPAADVALGTAQVPVLGAINGTIVQVAPPDGGL